MKKKIQKLNSANSNKDSHKNQEVSICFSHCRGGEKNGRAVEEAPGTLSGFKHPCLPYSRRRLGWNRLGPNPLHIKNPARIINPNGVAQEEGMMSPLQEAEL